MTSPELPEQPTAAPTDGDPNASASPESREPREPREPEAPAASTSASTPEASASADDPGSHEGADGDHDDGDAGEGPEGSSGEPGSPATAGAAPGTGKRKRRRRRKGAGANAGGVPGAPPGDAMSSDGAPAAEDGSAPEGDAAAKPAGATQGRDPRDKKKRERSPRPERERPAFNVGDVVFGKITEISGDALFVDLAGKGRAIFDRRELDLPDEPPPGAGDSDEPYIDDEPDGSPAGTSAAHAGDAVDDEAAGDGAPPVEDEPSASAPAETPEAAASSTVLAGADVPAGDARDARDARDAPATDDATEGTILMGATTVGDGVAPAAVEGAESPEEVADATEAASEDAAEAASDGAPTAGAPSHPIWPVVTLELGQQFVGAVHNDGGRGGLVVLTRHPRRAQRAKLVVAGAFKEKGEIFGLVTGVIKGGVEVDVDGLRAFAPGSHMDLRLGADLTPLLGKRLLFQVTQYAKKGRDVVLSRKAFLEVEAKANREAALERLAVGTVVEGTVRSVVSFGAFLDVGGVEGLVPLSEMSHNRSEGPHDVFKQGEKTPVKILRVDEKGKVWLSRKAAVPDPWSAVAAKYPMGSKHAGKVVRLQPFGAFVELEAGIDGLIHTADLSVKRIEHPNEVVKEGDAIDVVVAHLDIFGHKIGLHPAPAGAAADEAPQRVQVHKAAKVAVVGHDAGGLFVRILGATGRNARGFITAAATGTPRGTDLRKSFPMNTQLDAKVIELDPKRGEVKLSIRAMQDDTERSAYRQYREQVTREAKFGTFGDLLAKKLQK